MAFHAFGAAALIFFSVHNFYPSVTTYGWKHWSSIMLDIAIGIVIFATATVLTFQLIQKNYGDAALRWLTFLTLWLASIIVGYLACWLYDATLGSGMFAWAIRYQQLPTHYTYGLFLAPITWLSCVYAQREDVERQFINVSLKRSLLATKLAKAQLISMRSRIDPPLVVRVLDKINASFVGAPDQSHQLLDKLVEHLRLAMNRDQVTQLTVATESALIHSYIEVRALELGRSIRFELIRNPDIQADLPTDARESIFPVARSMLNTMLDFGVQSVELKLTVCDNDCSISAISPDSSANNMLLNKLEKDLNNILRRPCTLQYKQDECRHSYYEVSLGSK